VPVLVERTALVLPREALGGEAAAAVRALHPESWVEDDALVALSFSRRDRLQEAGRVLARFDLEPVRDGEPAEVAVVDQRGGPAFWWPWLELAVVEAPGGGTVLAGRKSGDEARPVAVPPAWAFPGSASEVHGVGALELVDRPLRHVDREAGADVYVDRWTGEMIRLRRSSPPIRLAVSAPGGVEAEVTVEVAARWPEIEIGLMFRASLPPDGGMLFRFPAARPHGFWMKNTLVPLDVLFIGEAGRVVNVAERTRPLRVRQHRSAGPVREVLELPGGWCAAHGVGPGARVGPAETLPVA